MLEELGLLDSEANDPPLLGRRAAVSQELKRCDEQGSLETVSLSIDGCFHRLVSNAQRELDLLRLRLGADRADPDRSPMGERRIPPLKNHSSARSTVDLPTPFGPIKVVTLSKMVSTSSKHRKF